jgi:hypothetical protein
VRIEDRPTQNKPIFYPESDPFVVRFSVKPIVWLPVEKSIPIHEDYTWNKLSFTRGQHKGSSTWTGKIRGSLVGLSDSDGELLESALQQQMEDGCCYPVDWSHYEKLSTHRVRCVDKDVTVTVTENSDSTDETPKTTTSDIRGSIRIRSLLAEIGSRMNMQIWIPRTDRAAVLAEWRGDHQPLLDRLPLNYDDTTLRTIEQINVLWLKGRAITRAFEVEHTTSIYSGILRMADLLALQPNMDIRVHIVAPLTQREKVFQQLRHQSSRS